MMGWEEIIAWSILPLYFIIELFVSYFFNRKIRHIGIGDYKKASYDGGIATFLYASMMILSAFTSGSLVYFPYGSIMYILFSAVLMALGNFTSTQILGYRIKKGMK